MTHPFEPKLLSAEKTRQGGRGMSIIPLEKLDEWERAVETLPPPPWSPDCFLPLVRTAMPELLAAYREAVALLGTYHRALNVAHLNILRRPAKNGDDEDLALIRAALSADGAQVARRLEALEKVAEALKACEDERQKAEERRGPISIFGVPIRQSPSPELYFAAVDALAALEKGKQPT